MVSREKPTVLIDVDGVLAGFDDRLLETIKQEYPHLGDPQTRDNFYMASNYPEEHGKTIKDITHRKGFFIGLPVVEGAFEGWQRIVDLGYNPRICSAPIITNRYSIAEKISWLRTNFVPEFGEYVVEQALITRDKHMAEGIALIDDRPEIYGAEVASWTHILFAQPYNSSQNGMPRLNGWLDPNLENFLAAALENHQRD